MKKITIVTLLLIIAISPIFKGLFFPYEMYIFFSVISALCITYFTIKLIKKEKFIYNDWSIYLGLAFVLSFCLSFINAVNVRANLETVVQGCIYFLVFLIVYDYFSENLESKNVLYIIPFTGMGLVSAIIGLAGYTKVFPELNDTINGERIGATFQYANTAAIFFLMLIVFIVSLIVNNNNKLVIASLSGIGNVFFMALFFTSSRGVFLVMPLIIFMVFFIVMPKGVRLKSIIYILCITLPVLTAMNGFYANSKIMNIISASKWIVLSAGISAICTFVFSIIFTLKVGKKLKYGAFGVITASGLAFIFIYRNIISSAVTAFAFNHIPKTIITRISDINLNTINVVARFEFYKDALKLIKDNWLIGLGGGGFASLYQSVQDKYYAARLVHNHFLQVFVESGILGFLAFTLITVLTCVYFIYARIKLTDKRETIYAAAFFCAFLAIALHSIIDFNLSFSSMSLMYWSMIGIAAAYFHKARNKTIIQTDKGSVKIMAVNFLAIVLSLSIGVFSAYSARSSYYAEQGAEYKKAVEAKEAIESYLNASRLDPLNANNHAELADLYSWMAYTSKTEAEKNEWIEKAIHEGEEAIRLDGNYPYYNKILTDIYFNAGMSIKACEQAQKLISLQPRVSANYELLARGYLEAGLQYIREKDYEKGREYITKCTTINEYPDVKINNNFNFYQGKAFLILGEFEKAEKLLLKARNGSLELKMESDRLLYIINEETGRAADNSKYKGVPWMGTVKLTPVYKEIKQILSEKILEKK